MPKFICLRNVWINVDQILAVVQRERNEGRKEDEWEVILSVDPAAIMVSATPSLPR